MELNWLPANTRALWKILSIDKQLGGFVLVGGTALCMRIGHRVSEDLDFAYLGQTLPRQRIKVFLKSLQKKSIHAQPTIDLAAQDDFIDAGLDLNDYQQNYVLDTGAGKVKVSFIAFEDRIRQCLRQTHSDFARVSDLDEIFRTKVLCACDRAKSRDWVDLYVLMKYHGFSPMDLYAALEDTGSTAYLTHLDRRLRKLQVSAADEGYTQLMQEPPSLEVMREFFNASLNEIEVQLAARRFAR